MELITNKSDDLRIIKAHYGDIEIPIYIDKHTENVFISLNDLPLLLNSPPDNTSLSDWCNIKKAIAQTLTNQS